jgi:Ca2+:H+ antiporter
MSTAQLQGLVDDDPIIDRGEDLIKRRQAERKKLRRAKSRANDEPETPNPDDSFGYRSFGPSTGRSVSRSRMPSARKQFSEGVTSYAGSVADDTRSFRPPSINSAADEEEQQDLIDEVVADVVDEAGQEEEEEDVEDEGLTLRDRQDVSRACSR